MQLVKVCVLLFVFIATPSVQKAAVTKVPALGSMGKVLEEASKDLKNRGEGRKSIEYKENMEKRLKEIWPLEQDLWGRAETLANVTPPRTNASSSTPLTNRKKVCIIIQTPDKP